MRVFTYLTTAVATTLIGAGIASGAVVEDFESLSTGNIVGQAGWTATTVGTGNTATVVTSPTPYEGSKMLQIVDSGGGSGNNYFIPLEKRLDNAQILPFNGETMSYVVKRLSAGNGGGAATTGLYAAVGYVTPANAYYLQRDQVDFRGNTNDIWWSAALDGATTGGALGTYALDTWYRVERTLTVTPGDEHTTHLVVTNTSTNTVIADQTFTNVYHSDRTYFGGISFYTNSTPSGTWLVDDIRWGVVPEPSGVTAALAATISCLWARRRRA